MVKKKIKLNRILWRTRGYEWDYETILVPVKPLRMGWYSVIEKIFENVEIGNQTTYVTGEYDAKTVFIAAGFTDSSHQDEFGRNIGHYIVWFESKEKIEAGFPKGWERQLIDKVSNIIYSDDLFYCKDAELNKMEMMIKKLKEIGNAIDVEGDPIEKKDVKKTLEKLNDGDDADKTIEETKKEINKAIRKGHYYAATRVTGSEYFPSFKRWFDWFEKWFKRLFRRWLERRFERWYEKGQEKISMRKVVAETFSTELDGRFAKRISGIVYELTNVTGIGGRESGEPGFDAIMGVLQRMPMKREFVRMDREEKREFLVEVIDHNVEPDDKMIENIINQFEKGQ